MKKHKKKDNILEYVPYKNPNFEVKVNEDGKITLIVPRRGIINKLAQFLFFAPKRTYLHMDNLGSFVWDQIDGARNIEQIAGNIKNEYKEKANPLYERLITFLKLLQKNGFILIRRPDQKNKLYFNDI